MRLGKGVTDPPSTRLPMRCFLDFKPGGSLCHIFSNMFRYKVDQRWRKFEFNVTKNQRKDKDPNHPLSVEIETTLIEQECLRLPVAYVRPDVDPELRERITEILTNHQGEITEDEEEATHIIYPEIDPLPDDYARPSFKRGKNVMMHWYYLPESYDSWVPNSFELPVSVENRVTSSVDNSDYNDCCCLVVCRTMFQRMLVRHKTCGVYRPHGFFIYRNTMNGWLKKITR